MRTNTNRRLHVVASDTVEQRLKRAFPEVNLDRLAERSSTLNAHNIAEKWDATVRSVQFWVDLANPS